MSGHITSTSRGSRVGSSASRPEQDLAEHVDLPGDAVAGMHLHRPVARREHATGRDAVRRRRGRPAASRAGCRGGRTAGSSVSLAGVGDGQRRLELAGVAAEARQQRMAHRPRGCRRRPAPPHRGVRPARPRARATGAAARRGRRAPPPARRAGRSRSPTAGCGRTGTGGPGGRTPPGPHAASRPCGGVARSATGASTRATRRRQSSGCQARSPASGRPAPSVSRPSDQSATSDGR